jgi:hypothetical protein
MILNTKRIQINEGGYLCGLTWVRGKLFDVWFKLPIRGSKSHRFTRVAGE